jgi:hypothetical protein
VGVAVLGICDFLYASRTRSRWFGLHAIANGWISLLCLPDLWFILSDPLTALTQTEVNHWPTALVFSVHVYHMVVMFRTLYFIDWLHHILMVVVGAPLLITGMIGPLANFNNFFMCGVPGGLDYALLFAVKHTWISPIAEKRWNKTINVWIRAPALVWSSCLVYCQMFLQEGVPGWVKAIRVFLMFLGAWNGLFFMERVVGNYHVSAFKARKQQQEQLSPQQMREASDYDSDAHFTHSGVPGMGMRIAVSSDDLQRMKEQAQPTDAYPVDAKRKRA